MPALMILEDLPAGELRRLAKAERDLRVAQPGCWMTGVIVAPVV